jgi:NAD(P)-dependent dehydrogenase (short-subunit alcohol dehydrogenase family)
MKPPFLSLTSEWHNDTYPDIDPRRPELSVQGKTVIISGGGTGIGRETARAFAQAGAAKVVIFGRRHAPLEETKSIIEAEIPTVQVLPVSADITNLDSMKHLAQQAGNWDILVLNSGYCSDKLPVDAIPLEEWWYTFEVSVKGGFIAVKSLLPTRNKGAKVIATQSGQLQLPASLQQGWSSYGPAKIASSKIYEILAAEVPDVLFFNFHPGVVQTDMLAKSEKSGSRGLPIDTVQLPAHFTVWLASPEATFLNGKFSWTNWDVTELKSMAKDIESTELLTVNVLGVPLTGVLNPDDTYIMPSPIAQPA